MNHQDDNSFTRNYHFSNVYISVFFPSFLNLSRCILHSKMDQMKLKSNFCKVIFYDNEDDTIVRFVFENELYKIKAYKSLLSEISPVFKDIFNDCQGKFEFKMNDSVAFDQFEIFKLFLEIIYGLTDVDTLTIDQAICVHFYAHKYQIHLLCEMIREIMTKKGVIGKTFSVMQFIHTIQMTELHSWNDLKDQLKNIQLNIKDQSEALSIYKTCMDHNMQSLIGQVVSFLVAETVNDHWPRDLVIRVLEQLRNNLFCFHDINDYRKFKTCNICITPMKDQNVFP